MYLVTTDDCRDEYACLAAEDLGDIRIGYTSDDDEGDAPLARNLDNESAKFCTVDPED